MIALIVTLDQCSKQTSIEVQASLIPPIKAVLSKSYVECCLWLWQNQRNEEILLSALESSQITKLF